MGRAQCPGVAPEGLRGEAGGQGKNPPLEWELDKEWGGGVMKGF